MGVLDFLFQGSPPENVNASTVTQTNMPDWYQEYTRGLLARSNEIAAQDYQGYDQARVAGLTADQTAGNALIQNNVGMQNPYIDSAQNMLSNAGGGLDQSRFQGYLSPYQDQVNSRIATLGQRNLQENLLPAVNETFTNAGQFGGSRNAEFTNRALRDANESILGQQAQSMNQGYQQAMQSYLTGQQQELGAGQQMGALGTAAQQANIRDAAALQSVGQTQQALNQQNLDVGYQNFLEQRNWPTAMAQFMNQQVRGFNPPTQTSSASSTPGNYNNMSPSPLAQLVGTGISAAALLGAGK
jgi:hypothetical protein